MKHTISLATLLTVSAIAMLSLMFETRQAEKLTRFGYVVLLLTACSLILGIAAQIYTIREERRKESEARAKHVEQQEHLGRIESEVRSSTRPVLPITLFYTIRHSPKSHAIEAAFSGVKGFKTSHSEILRLVGSARLSGNPLGYNSIEATASESHCVLEGDPLADVIKKHTGFSAIREALSTILEFFLSVNGEIPDEPNLVLEKTYKGSPTDVAHLELFDDVVFQDSFVRDWTGRVGAGQSWSMESLYNARVRLSLKFLGKCGPVALHDFQLFFGPMKSMHGIRFTEKDLATAVFEEDPNPLLHPSNDLAKEIFTQYVLRFECVLSPSLLSDHLVRIV